MYSYTSRRLASFSSLGLLVIRLGIGGVFFAIYGLPKLQGGPDLWTKIGGAMGQLGIHVFPTFFGFMASASECVGGLLLILGLFTRPAALFMCFTMIVATLTVHSMHKPLSDVAHPFELACLFFALIFLGPGRYSLDAPLGAA